LPEEMPLTKTGWALPTRSRKDQELAEENSEQQQEEQQQEDQDPASRREESPNPEPEGDITSADPPAQDLDVDRGSTRDAFCPNQEGGVEQRHTNPHEDNSLNEEDQQSQHEQEHGKEDNQEHSSLLQEAEVEALLREQQQQFVSNLAEQRRAQQEHYEAELAALRQSLERQSVHNHVQPPPRPMDVHQSLPPQEVPMSKVLSILPSLRTEVAGLKRQAHEGTSEAPPASRRRVDERGSTAPSSTFTIPGLPADVAAAVHEVVQQPSHPAFGLSPSDVPVLRLKSRPQGINPGDKLSTSAP
ncbi:hypothetical protein KEM55_000799, partial [Ascosphaera atra]